jgi:hypothetical protein
VFSDEGRCLRKAFYVTSIDVNFGCSYRGLCVQLVSRLAQAV